MRRLTVWIVSTAAGVVLLFSYHTSASGPAGGRVVAGVAPVGIVAEAPAVDPTVAPTAASLPATTTVSPSPMPAGKKTAAATRRINGVAASTRYGPVQVQITVQGSRVLSAEAIAYPTANRRDEEINSRAVPQLDDEAMRAQSAQIDTVSGASYTSDGYRTSLQSALDAAHL